VGDFDRELDDEIRAHVEHRADDLERGGLPRDEALRRARVEFGAAEAVKERLRDDRLTWLRRLPGGLWRDLRLAGRRLRQSPVFALFAIASLAVGVGATTAVYSLIQAAIWPDVGVPDETRVVFVGGRDEFGDVRWRRFMSRADFDDLRAQQTSLTRVAASASMAHAFTDGAVAAFQSAEAVTGAYFEALGVGALLGRTLGPADDAPGAPAVLVVSETFWRRTLESDPDVLGRVVQYGGHPFQIVGVAAPSFGGLEKLEGPQRRTDVWIPMAAAARLGGRALPAPTDREARWLAVIGRLADGQAVDRSSAELAAIAARLDVAFPFQRTTRDGALLANPRDWTVRTVAQARAAPTAVNVTAGIVIGIVGLVLVVASTNLANLTLARGSGRASELGVRRALGASRGRLVRELAAESLLVGIAGGLAALWMAHAIVDAIGAGMSIAGSTVAERFDPRLDWRVFLFGSGAAVLAFVVSGLVPALRLTRAERTGALGKDASGAGAARWRGQRRLIAAQVAISTALFLVAALGVAMIAAESRDDTGIDIDRLAIASVILRGPAWTDTRTRATLDEVLTEVARQPGIEAAAVTFGLQLGPRGASFITAAPDGGTPDAARGGHNLYFVPGSPGLLATLGVPIVRGRALQDRDVAAAPAVAVVSERAARLLFGTTSAVDREIVWRGALNMPDRTTVGRLTIVGVARDTATGSRAAGQDGVIYVPAAQHPLTPVPPFVIARHAGSVDGRAAATTLQTVIRRIAPDAPITGSGTGPQVLAESLQAWRTVSNVTLGLGACALLLTLVGLYGVLAHVVSRRTREMGVRMALGATRRQVIGLVLREGLRPVVIGIAAGIGTGVLLRMWARSLFVDAPAASEPLVFSGVATALLAAGAMACVLPARRAARVDPNVALRDL
jgi:predicted permease